MSLVNYIENPFDVPLDTNEEGFFKAVSSDDYFWGFIYSFILGGYYLAEASIPIIIWYTLRRPAVLSMSTNVLYKISWYTFFASHLFIYFPLVLVWAFSYLGYETLLDVYYLLSYWMGGWGGILVTGLNFTMYLLSSIFYQSDTNLLNWNAPLEAFAYLFLQTGTFYICLIGSEKTAFKSYYFAYADDAAVEQAKKEKIKRKAQE